MPPFNVASAYPPGGSTTYADPGLQVAAPNPRLIDQLAALYNAEQSGMRRAPMQAQAPMRAQQVAAPAPQRVETPMFGGGGRMATEAVQHGNPVYSRVVHGPGVVPGRIRLQQWEPGADFSGYE